MIDVISGSKRWAIAQGDALDVLRWLPVESVDALVTDPPAGISFMGKGWDGDKGGREQWIEWLASIARECLRVLKPGAHALVWAIPRTSHWTATALEVAGFEVRDVITHHHGTGFPKSLNVSKAIEASGTDDPTGLAVLMAGWGTALKPASEHWILCRKPLDGTVAANVLKHGTGGLNIDACRIGTDAITQRQKDMSPYHGNNLGAGVKAHTNGITTSTIGRWPANLLLSHSDACELAGVEVIPGKGKGSASLASWRRKEGRTDLPVKPEPVAGEPETRGVYTCAPGCPVAELDRQSGERPSGTGSKNVRNRDERVAFGKGLGKGNGDGAGGDTGGASRYFKVFKPCSNSANDAASDLTDGPDPDSALSPVKDDRSFIESTISRSTCATPKDSKKNKERDTQPIPNIAAGCEPASTPMSTAGPRNHAHDAGTPKQTGTTTIIPSLWNSNGYADDAISGSTSSSADRGEPGCGGSFIYTSKPSRRERDTGCDALPLKAAADMVEREEGSAGLNSPRAGAGRTSGARNFHPTVKARALMAYLCRLITPPGGVVLDPFTGSGSTGVACMSEGYRFIGVELDPEYVAIARARVEHAQAETEPRADEVAGKGPNMKPQSLPKTQKLWRVHLEMETEAGKVWTKSIPLDLEAARADAAEWIGKGHKARVQDDPELVAAHEAAKLARKEAARVARVKVR